MIPDFRGFDLKQNLNYKGWNSHVHRELFGNLESSNLSREMFIMILIIDDNHNNDDDNNNNNSND